MKLIFETAYDISLLQLLKQTLLDQNIPCFSKNEFRTGGAAGEVPPIVCKPQLWVQRDEDEAAARTLIEGILNRTKPVDWTCSCGEKIEGQFSSCWNCGADAA